VGAALVAEHPQDRFLTREVAEMLGVSISILRKLHTRHRETLGASDVGRHGSRCIWLYTPADVDRLRAHFLTSPTAPPRRRNSEGRPALWDPPERADRGRGYVRMNYHRRRAQRLDALGETAAADEHRAQVQAIKDDLDRERRQRYYEQRYVTPLDGAARHEPQQP
jgi:hypothetical protein